MKNNHKKATSQSIWIVISIVVAVAVALGLIIAVNSMISKSQKSTEGPMETAASTLEIQTCERACDSCMQIYGDADCASNWGTTIGQKCVDEDILTSCQ